MTKVYIEKQGAPELPLSLVFRPNYRFAISPKRLFLDEIISQYKEPFFEIVSNPKEADFFAVPFEYFFVLDQARKYLDSVYEKARAIGKKVLLFDYTDYVDWLPALPSHAILFRVSAYLHHKRENEIVMPYFVEDFGVRYRIAPKEMMAEPVVGYCGQSQFQCISRKWRARIKWLFYFLLLYLRRDEAPSVHKRGIFWRGQSLQILRQSGIVTLILERSFYSLHRGTMPIDPSEARREYVENLRESDLALCVRGDSNASQRFYEALSASRIPLFLDTDCVLPLKEIIPYDEFMIRVPSRKLKILGTLVRAWWKEQTPESFLVCERKTREIYEKYLRLDRYFNIVFDREKSPYKKLLYESR